MTNTTLLNRERPPGTAPLSLGAYAVTAGLAICMLGDAGVGGFLALCGVLFTVLGLHRLGRSGPDPNAVTKSTWTKAIASSSSRPTTADAD